MKSKMKIKLNACKTQDHELRELKIVECNMNQVWTNQWNNESPKQKQKKTQEMMKTWGDNNEVTRT